MVTEKKCNKCLEVKLASEFHKQNRNNDGLQSICKSCRRALDKDWYKENPVKKKQQKKYRQFLLEEIRIYKSERGCKYCGEKTSVCLDFHHKDDDKEFTIMSSIYKYGRDRLWQEIEKCDVVCANCHRKLHGGLV